MTNKILSFERTADFYLNRHFKAFDSGNYIDSLANIRSAIEKDPKNDEYKLLLAETLSEMGLYEESNFELFKLLGMAKTFGGDTIFDIAVNLFNLGDYAKAEETFLHYITDFPDGEHIEDAQDAYEMLTSSHEEPEPVKDMTMEDANRGKELLDSGQFKEAIDTLKPLCAKNPRAASLQNNLALAYFCIGENKKAIDISQRTLKYSPKNVHTLCNLAIFYSSTDIDKAKSYCDKLSDIKTTDEGDLNKMLLTFCEVGLHERAYDTVKSILEYDPYDTRMLFIYAAACSNTGRLAEALDAYMKMLYIDPTDSIAQYYKNKIQRIFEVSPSNVVEQSYIYQVPPSEIHRRLSYLHAESSKGQEHMHDLWVSDPNFYSMMMWGLHFIDPDIKRVSAELIASFKDSRAEDALRRFLMDSYEPDDVKNDLFILMARLKYNQPFLAYIGGKLAEVRVGEMESLSDISKSSQAVISLIASSEFCADDPDMMRAVAMIIDRYLAALGKPAKMVNKKAWAAAFIYYTLLEGGYRADITLGMICRSFGVAEMSVIRCLKLVSAEIGEDRNEQ